MPKTAAVSFSTGEVLAAAARVTGPEIPPGYPEQYTKGLRRVRTFNATLLSSVQELGQWQRRHGVAMEAGPLQVFQKYLSQGYVIFGALVQHPLVPKPGLYARCSVVLQRGLIVFEGGRETLFLRSYFHSARDATNFVNFTPSSAVEATFRSGTIWFPLELTRVIQEPVSYVVLDIFTRGPLDLSRLPSVFKAGKQGRTNFDGKTFRVTRISGKLNGGKEWPDLNLSP